MVYLGKHTMPVFLFKGWLEALSGDKIKFNVFHRYPAATTFRVYLSCPDCKFGLKYDQVEILDIGNILQLAFSLSEQFQNDMQNSRNLSLLGSMREEEIVSKSGKRRRCSSWLRKKHSSFSICWARDTIVGTYEGKFFNRAMDIFRQFQKLSINNRNAFWW